MLISYAYLKDLYGSFSLNLNDLEKNIVNLGFEIENMIEPIKKDVKTVKVNNVEKLINFDDLYKIDITDNISNYIVITSCSNIEVNSIYPYAPTNTIILDKEIKEKNFGTTKSQGMLLSYKELEINPNFLNKNEKEGIIKLPTDTPIGQNFYDLFYLSEPFLTLKTPSNRSDCTSLIGILREISASFDISIPEIAKNRIKLIYSSFDESKIRKSTDKFDFNGIELLNKEKCPFYSYSIIGNLNIVDSLYEIRKKLFAFGIRPINNAVDIANLIMFSYGQPLHTFDYKGINGKIIKVRDASKGESINGIDGNNYKLDENDLVIADENNPVAIGGIIGSTDAEVTKETNTILLESAYFNPATIYKSTKKLNIPSDASARFIKGVDKTKLNEICDITSKLIACVCKGIIVKEPTDVGGLQYKPKKILFSLENFQKTTGLKINKQETLDILKKLEFPCLETNESSFLIEVPSFRENDIKEEVDIIEDILRFIGYDKIIAKQTPFLIKYIPENRNIKVKNILRHIMIGFGFNEIVTDSFISDNEINELYPYEKNELVSIINPIKSGFSYLSPNKIFQICSIIKNNNARKHFDLKFFEIGKYYLNNSESEYLNFAVSGKIKDENWIDKSDNVDFYYLKGIIESIFHNYKIDFTFNKNKNDYFQCDESINYSVNNINVCSIGKINSKFNNFYDLSQPLYFGYLEIKTLHELILRSNNYIPILETHETLRDLSFIVDKKLKASEIIERIKNKAGQSLINVSIIDLFQGKNIPEDKKSIAFRIKFNFGTNMTGEQINNLINEIINEVCSKFDAKLRM